MCRKKETGEREMRRTGERERKEKEKENDEEKGRRAC